MLKMAPFDCAINAKCCSVDGGRCICPLFRPHLRGFDSSRVHTPGNLPSKAKKKNANARESARRDGGGGDWAQVELTNALKH